MSAFEELPGIAGVVRCCAGKLAGGDFRSRKRLILEPRWVSLLRTRENLAAVGAASPDLARVMHLLSCSARTILCRTATSSQRPSMASVSNLTTSLKRPRSLLRTMARVESGGDCRRMANPMKKSSSL